MHHIKQVGVLTFNQTDSRILNDNNFSQTPGESSVAFGFFIYFCVDARSVANTVSLGAVDALLAGTLYVVVRHYFPKKECTHNES